MDGKFIQLPDGTIRWVPNGQTVEQVMASEQKKPSNPLDIMGAAPKPDLPKGSLAKVGGQAMDVASLLAGLAGPASDVPVALRMVLQAALGAGSSATRGENPLVGAAVNTVGEGATAGLEHAAPAANRLAMHFGGLGSDAERINDVVGAAERVNADKPFGQRLSLGATNNVKANLDTQEALRGLQEAQLRGRVDPAEFEKFTKDLRKDAKTSYMGVDKQVALKAAEDSAIPQIYGATKGQGYRASDLGDVERKALASNLPDEQAFGQRAKDIKLRIASKQGSDLPQTEATLEDLMKMLEASKDLHTPLYMRGVVGGSIGSGIAHMLGQNPFLGAMLGYPTGMSMNIPRITSGIGNVAERGAAAPATVARGINARRRRPD